MTCQTKSGAECPKVRGRHVSADMGDCNVCRARRIRQMHNQALCVCVCEREKRVVLCVCMFHTVGLTGARIDPGALERIGPQSHAGEAGHQSLAVLAD